MSMPNRWPPEPSRNDSTARPEIFASPPHELGSPSGGSSVGQWRARRGSRCRSRAFSDPGIMPSHGPSSANSTSEPLMRGDRSRRSVARVQCFPVPKRARTRAANSGSASTKSRHRVTSPSWRRRRGSGERRGQSMTLRSSYTATGSRFPFRLCRPSGLTRARSPRRSRVAGPMRTCRGSAIAWSLAATLVVSPMTV